MYQPKLYKKYRNNKLSGSGATEIRNTRVSITNKTDIFAIGQIMYEMLLGRVPTIGAEYQYKARQDTWIQIPR